MLLNDLRQFRAIDESLGLAVGMGAASGLMVEVDVQALGSPAAHGREQPAVVAGHRLPSGGRAVVIKGKAVVLQRFPGLPGEDTVPQPMERLAVQWDQPGTRRPFPSTTPGEDRNRTWCRWRHAALGAATLVQPPSAKPLRP